MSWFDKVLSKVLETGTEAITRDTRRLAALRQLGPDFEVWFEYAESLPERLTALANFIERAGAERKPFDKDPIPHPPATGLWGDDELIHELARGLDLDHRTSLLQGATAVRELLGVMRDLWLPSAEPVSGYRVPVNFVERLREAARRTELERDRFRRAVDGLAGEAERRALLAELNRPAESK